MHWARNVSFLQVFDIDLSRLTIPVVQYHMSYRQLMEDRYREEKEDEYAERVRLRIATVMENLESLFPEIRGEL